jgi:hypothetical protein
VELEGSKTGATGIKGTMLNPLWQLAPGELEAVQGFFLQAAVSYVNEPAHWREIRKGRTELIRVKKSPSGSAEWLAFAFGSSQTAPALGADFAGSTILVVVDPIQAFASLAQPGAGLSGYLAGSDGHVLVHSSREFDGAELGGVPAFQAGIAAIQRAGADRRALSGSAVVKSALAEGGATVTLAAAKVPAQPLYLIVEKQLRAPPLPAARSAPKATIPNPRRDLELTVLIGILIGLAIYAGQLIQKRIAAARAEAEALQRELDARRAAEAAYLDEIRKTEEARVREQMRRADEARLAEEARHREELGRIKAAEQELVRQFEIEVLKQDGPKKIAHSVSHLAHRLCRAPALFFAYQPLTHKALLTATAGLSRTAPRTPFMVELSDVCLKRIQQADERGETASLSDYLPLSSLLQLHFHASQFQPLQFRAWALTGETRVDWTGRTQSRFLGILCVLPSDEQGESLPVGPWIPSLLKTAGRQYEKAVPSV